MEVKSLFKYMPHYDGKFFEQFFLRATQRSELNDPFEFVPTRDFYEAAINYTEPGKDLSWLKDITYEQFCSGFFPNEGVISFTETRSNLLMWAHYSQRHTGFVAEFDITKDFFKTIKRVRYNNIKPNQILNLEDLLFLKSDEWIYEKEYRIVEQLDKHDYYIKKSDMIVNPAKHESTHNPKESEEMYMFNIPKDSIISVTFGCNMEERIKEIILNKIANDDELKDVVLWQAKLSKDYFHLEFEKI